MSSYTLYSAILHVVEIPMNLPITGNFPRLCSHQERDSIQVEGKQFKNQITTFISLVELVEVSRIKSENNSITEELLY